MGRKRLDLTGDRYGRLIVIRENECIDKVRRYLCMCDCGSEKIVTIKDLRSGNTRSCGCLQRDTAKSNALDLVGKRFGKLVVMKRIGSRNNQADWQCLCDCGGTAKALSGRLTSGITKSCGCLKEARGEKVQKYINENLMVDGVYIALLKSKIRNDNNTGVKGVYPTKRKNKIKYRASIGIKNKQYHLGYFDTVEEAAAARKAGEEKYHQPYLE